jgi:hypothetical protein
MKYVKILLLFSSILLLSNAEAQVLKSRIAKLGYSSYFMPFQEDGHFSFHFDLENSTRNNFISNEFGAGFMSNGSDLYYMKFDYKFYPISALVNNFRYQLLYVSMGPGIYYEHVSKMENGIGLGVFTTGGLQFLVNNRLSIAFELEMNFVSNLNGELENGSYSSSNKRHFTNSFKIGYVFNR